MQVSAILKEKGHRLVTVSPDHTISDVTRTLASERIGAVVVIDDGGEVVGILSERDIVRGLSESGASLLNGRVAELMTKSVVTCTPDSKIDQLMHDMTNHRIRHLPVIDNGRLAGLISIGDVVKVRLDELENESTMLRDYIEHG